MMSECPLRDTAQTRTPLVRIPSFLARTPLLTVDVCQVERDDGRLSGGRDSGAQTGGSRDLSRRAGVHTTSGGVIALQVLPRSSGKSTTGVAGSTASGVACEVQDGLPLCAGCTPIRSDTPLGCG